MKKVYTTPGYKQRHNRRSKKSVRRRKKQLVSRQQKIKRKQRTAFRPAITVRPPLPAPGDLRLFHHPEACFHFFRKLRREEQHSFESSGPYVRASLAAVELIDHASVSILNTITYDLSYQGISFQGELPAEPSCKQFIIDSGFLHNMHDEAGVAFPKMPGSDIIFFERGCGKLSFADIVKVTETLANVAGYLGDETAKCMPIRTIMLEVFGNSIEWSGAREQQWLMGLKYEENRVVFTLTDVGQGILETLQRKFLKQIGDVIHFRQKHNVLMRAFMQKYGSATGEQNRNKGLPYVRQCFEKGFISHLKVVTNNVILDFSDTSQSRTITRKNAQFDGTFFQWEMTPTSLLNIKNSRYVHAKNR